MLTEKTVLTRIAIQFKEEDKINVFIEGYTQINKEFTNGKIKEISKSTFSKVGELKEIVDIVNSAMLDDKTQYQESLETLRVRIEELIKKELENGR